MHTARHARHAIAFATLICCATPGLAGVTPSGSVGTSPAAGPIGPGDTELGAASIRVGNAALGTLAIDGGSLLRAGGLYAGNEVTGQGAVTIDGAGTRVELSGDGTAGFIHRIEVGAWGQGSLTVSGGALLDARLRGEVCGTGTACSTFIGNASGSTATWSVLGAGSEAWLRDLYVGNIAVYGPPADAFSFGAPGGITTARVEVAAGGRMVADFALLGFGQSGSAVTGGERSVAELAVRGAASTLVLTGQATTNRSASLSVANHRNTWGTLAIAQGGLLEIQGPDTVFNALTLASNGGRADASVSGPGSLLLFSGANGVVSVGRSLGSATLALTAGAQVGNVFYTAVGRDGSVGQLTIDGAGTLYRADGRATAAANGATGSAIVDIGRGGGFGTLTLSGGARLELLSGEATTNGSQLNAGRDAASSGTLNIGGGAVLLARSASVAPGTAGEAWNPFVRIGRDGNGTLNITGGGQLLLDGGAVSTIDFTRRTSLFIGGSGDTTVGGRGVATVSGAGSQIVVSGADAYIGIGHGPLASGNVLVSNQGRLAATILGVGNFSGTGVLRLDNARVDLAGQYTGSGEFGAALVVGAQTGAVGNVQLLNGSVVQIDNLAGANGGGFTIGGSRTQAGGDGSVSLSGGSRIEVLMPAGVGGGTVGRSGSGLLRLSGGSSVDVGQSFFTVGAFSGSDGTVIATEGSTITAGWVGVGRRYDSASGTDLDGGTGTMVLNGATLYAQDVVIGSNGFLGGSAGSIVVSGSVTNHGIFAPGSSPGTFTIAGSFVAGASSRLLLEVQSDGQGGFLTDLVRFDGTADLGSMAVEFRFLGDTDPNAFQQSGSFEIDTFLQQTDGQGGYAGLAAATFADVDFSASAEAYAIQSFAFSAEGGASIVAVPVPEASTWALWLAGLAAVGAVVRRRRSV